ncbi:hypothetical protein [Ohtaekwangia sp.]|uniref:hypothetical protein n=1 Tax=Ohtaekwangia sp. TaxID=2066019 RepID=UPI002F948809
MDIEREKSLLLEELKEINDPELLQSIRNLIANAKRCHSKDFLQADRELHDQDLEDVLATIKHSRQTNQSTDLNK